VQKSSNDSYLSYGINGAIECAGRRFLVWEKPDPPRSIWRILGYPLIRPAAVNDLNRTPAIPNPNLTVFVKNESHSPSKRFGNMSRVKNEQEKREES
jgi:hypothetical protein